MSRLAAARSANTAALVGGGEAGWNVVSKRSTASVSPAGAGCGLGGACAEEADGCRTRRSITTLFVCIVAKALLSRWIGMAV